MPQIWPMNWLILFVLFTFTFIVFLSFTYFIPQTPSFENKTNNVQVCTLNWKW